MLSSLFQLWKAAKSFKIFKNTKYLKLIFEKNDDLNLICYVDPDWASDVDRKSTSGCAIFYLRNSIYWLTRKQNRISTKAKYIASATAAVEILSLKGLAEEMLNPPIQVNMYVDNQGVVRLRNNYDNSKRRNHIDVKYHLIKD